MIVSELRKKWKPKRERFVQDFIRKHQDLIKKKAVQYNDEHSLYGTCYPAAWFFYELYKGEIAEDGYELIVMRRPMPNPDHGNHTFCWVKDTEIILDPTRNQVVNNSFKWYSKNMKRSSQMIAHSKMPHKMTRKLLELWTA